MRSPESGLRKSLDSARRGSKPPGPRRGRTPAPCPRWLGREAKDGLSAEGLAKKGELGAGRLYILAHDLGVHHRYGAMRPYSANLSGQPVPLETAMEEIWRSAGRPTSYVTFGKE